MLRIPAEDEPNANADSHGIPQKQLVSILHLSQCSLVCNFFVNNLKPKIVILHIYSRSYRHTYIISFNYIRDNI